MSRLVRHARRATVSFARHRPMPDEPRQPGTGRPPHQKEFNMDQHPALARGRAAVITGAASGIGFGAARHFARLGMKVCLADLAGEALEQSAAAVSALADNPDHVIAVPTDVGNRAEVERLKDEVIATFGEVAFLMNNAGIEGGG